jgi:hypothetical protein
MALSDYEGELVLTGTWLYAGVQLQHVAIIARNYDVEFSMLAAEDALEPDDQPIPLGPDGRLYYVQGTSSPGHPTFEEAMAWADAQSWGPVKWNKRP